MFGTLLAFSKTNFVDLHLNLRWESMGVMVTESLRGNFEEKVRMIKIAIDLNTRGTTGRVIGI